MLFGISLGLRMLWTEELSRFHAIFIVAEVWPRFKMGFLVVIFFRGQLEIASMIKAFRRSRVLLLKKDLALCCFRRCCGSDRRSRAD